MPKFQHDRLLAVDIETVRDDRIASPDGPPRKFAKPCFHKIVAISFVEARIERSGGSEAFLIDDCRSGGEDDYDEGRLIGGFWRFFERKAPRLVTWNGRTHDMAVLRLRGMMRGIDVSSWSARRHGRGYQFRYASDWHADLLDELSDYGASVKLSLDEAARAFGFPGKIVTGPGTVESLHREGKTAQIQAYCESDALNLFGIYVRWAKATGLSSEKDCQRGLDRLGEYLEDRREKTPHFAIFADRWKTTAAFPDMVGQAKRPDPERPAGSVCAGRTPKTECWDDLTAAIAAAGPPGSRRGVEPPPRVVRMRSSSRPLPASPLTS